MIENVIFDLDGTLIDSVAISVEILNEMLADRGSVRAIGVAEASAHVSLGGAPMVAALLGAECGEPAVEIVDFRQRYADRPTPNNSLFHGVREGLAELHGLGLRLAICSNKPQHLCEKVLADLNLAPFFDVVVGGAVGRRPKPETDLMDITLAQIGALAEHCIFVGDSELDHALSVACGVPFKLVNYGYADADAKFERVARFDHFSDAVHAIIADCRLGLAAPFAQKRRTWQ
jgi:phosphoglycolate phosphatase